MFAETVKTANWGGNVLWWGWVADLISRNESCRGSILHQPDSSASRGGWRLQGDEWLLANETERGFPPPGARLVWLELWGCCIGTSRKTIKAGKPFNIAPFFAYRSQWPRFMWFSRWQRLLNPGQVCDWSWPVWRLSHQHGSTKTHWRGDGLVQPTVVWSVCRAFKTLSVPILLKYPLYFTSLSPVLGVSISSDTPVSCIFFLPHAHHSVSCDSLLFITWKDLPLQSFFQIVL